MPLSHRVSRVEQIDRCYAWKSTPDGPARISLDKQESGTIAEFEDRAARIRTGEFGAITGWSLQAGRSAVVVAGWPVATVVIRLATGCVGRCGFFFAFEGGGMRSQRWYIVGWAVYPLGVVGVSAARL